MKIFLILTSFFLISFLSNAQTQLEINTEANTEYQKADKELNSTYKKILKEYSTDLVFIKNLKIAQNIWIKFRDAEVNMKYPPREPGYYGSIQPTCRSMYMNELTKKRIKELKIWLTGIPEGDACSGSVKMKN
ncbi:lysozyme inhibitor LprI family protein [Flavobacterium sp. LB3R33]|uniref:lysozyme inhibitor LprI family protein n=1 Tax=Flavobacterium sp. LB3R33 TaxID=3401721 RepID=UPI003AAF4B01